MINTLLIDREAHSLETLTNHLTTYCPQIEVQGVASSCEEGYRLAQSLKPELVFLNVNIFLRPGNSVFEQAAKKFETILMHANKTRNTLPAHFQPGAYLLKPIKAKALIKAVHHIVQRIQLKKTQQEICKLLHTLINHSPSNNLIGIPTLEGMEFLKAAEISRCEGLQRFTRVVTGAGTSIISSYNIGRFCELLSPYSFFSPHKSHLINLQHIRRYSQEGTIIMLDGSAIPVSRRRKNSFFQQIRHL